MPEACGRECKLGWGYNEYLNLLISVQGEPPNAKSEVLNSWYYSTPSTVSSTDIERSVSFSFAH